MLARLPIRLVVYLCCLLTSVGGPLDLVRCHHGDGSSALALSFSSDCSCCTLQVSSACGGDCAERHTDADKSVPILSSNGHGCLHVVLSGLDPTSASQIAAPLPGYTDAPACLPPAPHILLANGLQHGPSARRLARPSPGLPLILRV